MFWNMDIANVTEALEVLGVSKNVFFFSECKTKTI